MYITLCVKLKVQIIKTKEAFLSFIHSLLTSLCSFILRYWHHDNIK